jgi:hypothetical protein
VAAIAMLLVDYPQASKEILRSLVVIPPSHWNELTGEMKRMIRYRLLLIRGRPVLPGRDCLGPSNSVGTF